MGRPNYCDKKHPCIHCGDCCRLIVCGYAMEKRGYNNSHAGPCEYLRPDPEEMDKYLCGIYLDLLKAGKKVSAGIMARNLHFSKGCTNHKNERRQALCLKSSTELILEAVK